VNRVFLGSCESMTEVASGSVHCCVTSPPYYGLRRYNENAVTLRRNLSDEERAYVLAELEKHDIRPR